MRNKFYIYFILIIFISFCLFFFIYKKNNIYYIREMRNSYLKIIDKNKFSNVYHEDIVNKLLSSEGKRGNIYKDLFIMKYLSEKFIINDDIKKYQVNITDEIINKIYNYIYNEGNKEEFIENSFQGNNHIDQIMIKKINKMKEIKNFKK